MYTFNKIFEVENTGIDAVLGMRTEKITRKVPFDIFGEKLGTTY